MSFIQLSSILGEVTLEFKKENKKAQELPKSIINGYH